MPLPRQEIDHEREGVRQAAFARQQRDLPLPQIEKLARQLVRIGGGLGRHVARL
jgi:hypothetical protein